MAGGSVLKALIDSTPRARHERVGRKSIRTQTGGWVHESSTKRLSRGPGRRAACQCHRRSGAVQFLSHHAAKASRGKQPLSLAVPLFRGAFKRLFKILQFYRFKTPRKCPRA